MLRVALFPADATACGRYRLYYPARAARDAGDVEAGLCALRWENGRMVGMPEVDVAVFQRPARRELLDAIPAYQRRGIAVVVDMDDDLAAPDPRHPVFRELHPSNEASNWGNIKRACRLADLVTVTTPSLAARYGGRRARVLPNCVPSSLLEITAERDGRTVGWGGWTSTHVDDLLQTGGGVAQALDDVDGRFLLVGGELEDARRQLALEPERITTTGYVDFDEYAPTVARFDVGIVPLADSLFNRGKSALKGLEYAALGVPFVASPAPDYERLHQRGIGLLAGRGRDWRRQIRQLLTSQSLRDEVTARAQETVVGEHLYETNAWRWTEAWQEAIEIRRGTSATRAAA